MKKEFNWESREYSLIGDEFANQVQKLLEDIENGEYAGGKATLTLDYAFPGDEPDSVTFGIKTLLKKESGVKGTLQLPE